MSAQTEIDRLAGFLLKHHANEIGAGDPVNGESAVDVAIRLLQRNLTPIAGDRASICCNCGGRTDVIACSCEGNPPETPRA